MAAHLRAYRVALRSRMVAENGPWRCYLVKNGNTVIPRTHWQAEQRKMWHNKPLERTAHLAGSFRLLRHHRGWTAAHRRRSASGHHDSLYTKIHAMCYHRSGLCNVSTEETAMVKHVKVIVEKHPDGYVAYPLGLKGVIVGEGDTYEEALADVQSAITFHVETFGSEVVEDAASVLEVFVAEAGIPL